MRLSKAVAKAGICSRRKAEDLIQKGEVTVNGVVVLDPARQVNPEKDMIKVRGRLIKPPTPPMYYIVHKPREVITTLHDPQGRPTIRDLLKGVSARVYPVGRLDYKAEGLVLLTNDGQVAYRMMHPSYQVPRTYLVKVKGQVSHQTLQRSKKGVALKEGTRVARPELDIHRRLRSNTWIKVIIKEGRHHEVRQICERLGLRVLRLKRVGYGPLSIGGLKAGQYRSLTPVEVARLKRFLGIGN